MANIDEYIKQIQQAQYGEEVRGSIVNALKKVNDDNNSYVAIKKEVVAAKDIVEEKAEIFDEKANAAKETLTALQASTQIANEAKSSLNNIISSAISTKKELEQAVLETGEVIARVDNAKSNLDKSITSAGKAELNLQRQIETSNQIKNQLDVSNNTAIELKKNLDVAINEANTAKVKLVEAINNAGNAALEKIETAQSVATRAVETAKVEAVKAITTAGTTETKKVTDEGAKQVQTVQSIGTQETEKVTAEGTKQVGLVKTEGEKHLASVQTAAQEIIADREQIAKNKTDIAELRQNKADAIVETASGTLLNVKDSSGAFFEDFSMSGKTVQNGTPTPDTPVEIVNTGQDGTIEIKVTGKNLIPFPYPTISGSNGAKNGVMWEVLADGGIRLQGTASTAFYLDLDNNLKIGNILIAPGNTDGKIAVNKDVTYNGNITKAYIAVGKGMTVNRVYYPQIEYGTISTSYEPYRELQTITLSLDRPLTKWDRLEKREGVWGIVRQSAQEELTQYNFDTYILPSGSYPTGVYCYATKKSNAVLENQSSFCTHFKNSNYAYLATNAKIGLYSDHDKVRYKYFVSDKPTVEEFKAWLTQQKEAGTPVELVYKTAEETWEPLPEEMQSALNALHTNYPTTIISNSEDTEMELSYVADTKNYHLGREEILQKQILDIQNALISQKISGGGIKVTNSVKLPIAKLSVFGKSEQVQTTGAQLLNYYKLAELSPQYYAIEQGELKAKGSNNAAWTSVPEYGTLAAGTYTISGNNVEIRDASKNTVIATCTGDTFSKFTLNEDTAIKMKVGYGLDKYPTIVKAMLNKGDSKKPYEPYTGGKPSPSVEYPQEITSCGDKGTINLEITGDNAELQTLTIPTPNGLLGLKVDLGGNYTDSTGQQWICDEIDLARGKYVQRIAERIFDGTEAWEKYKENQYSLPKWADKKDKMIAYTENKYYLCNIARIKNKDSMAIGEFSTHLLNQGNGWILFGFAGTLEEWKRYLATKKAEGNPVTVQYILAEPVEYNLPPETIAAFKKLHTNYPTTLVSNNADAGMELTYTVDTQSYIDGKITEVSTAIVQKGI